MLKTCALHVTIRSEYVLGPLSNSLAELAREASLASAALEVLLCGVANGAVGAAGTQQDTQPHTAPHQADGQNCSDLLAARFNSIARTDTGAGATRCAANCEARQHE